MPFVVMRLPGGHPWSQKQNRLGAVQRLYLALFIHAQDHSAIRRIDILVVNPGMADLAK